MVVSIFVKGELCLKVLSVIKKMLPLAGELKLKLF